MVDQLRQKAMTGLVQNYGRARSLLYTAERFPLPILNRLITGVPEPAQDLEHLVEKVQELLQTDARDFEELNLPPSLLVSSGPIEHTRRWATVMADSVRSFWRRRNNLTEEFSSKVKKLDQYPKYYLRDFHHQTDGLVSDFSASVYEHQVELLFRGTANPMRRRLLKPMRNHLPTDKPIKILEVACGTGTFTRALAAAFPNAEITALDMSPNYIKHAKKRMINHSNVHFMVGAAESLPFLARSFDAVVTVFLHHELPPKVREKAINESLRVCTKDGFWGILDSIQMNDDPLLNSSLDDFPAIFHEPFYKNYVNSPLLDYVKNVPGQFQQEIHLTSKAVYRA